MKKNEEGQALLELIIFLPLMFTVYALVTGFANAIFGSINQQKATRAYFYYRVQNNSTIPRRPVEPWTVFGSFFVGWREKLVEDNPFQPCYRVSYPLAGRGQDEGSCDEPYSETSTQFMRVGTVYGFCGATYLQRNNAVFLLPNEPSASFAQVVDRGSCTIRQ